MVKVIFFDFDGVILDSMPIRDYGFRKIFEKYPTNLVEELISYHQLNGGLSRFHKIKYFYNEFLKENICDEKIESYALNFSKIMKKELINKKYLISQTIDFIESNYGKIIFHIVSGSEQKELRFLCEKLGLSKYFKTIEGSPTHKNDLVKNIINSENYNKDEAILIGDSINDYDAAHKNGLKFFGFNNDKLKEVSDFYIYNFNKKELSCKLY
ncbi:HAD family hydrolase [Malaciobacter canalis]|uniref:HAD family hydrolase n=1 Tax=Malaciobacter canalis TaxID=1912871 RepID=UPI003850B82D